MDADSFVTGSVNSDTSYILHLAHMGGYRVKSACKLPQPKHEPWMLYPESYTTACQIFSFSSRIKVDHVA